jgi:Rod binding domain-containing protein
VATRNSERWKSLEFSDGRPSCSKPPTNLCGFSFEEGQGSVAYLPVFIGLRDVNDLDYLSSSCAIRSFLELILTYMRETRPTLTYALERAQKSPLPRETLDELIAAEVKMGKGLELASTAVTAMIADEVNKAQILRRAIAAMEHSIDEAGRSPHGSIACSRNSSRAVLTEAEYLSSLSSMRIDTKRPREMGLYPYQKTALSPRWCCLGIAP